MDTDLAGIAQLCSCTEQCSLFPRLGLRAGDAVLWRTVRHPLLFIPAAASLWSMYLWHRPLSLEGSCSAAWVTTVRAGQYRIIFHRSCDFLFHMPMCLEVHKMFSGIPLGILWIYSCYYFLSNPIIFEKFLAIHKTETDTLFWITFYSISYHTKCTEVNNSEFIQKSYPNLKKIILKNITWECSNAYIERNMVS